MNETTIQAENIIDAETDARKSVLFWSWPQTPVGMSGCESFSNVLFLSSICTTDWRQIFRPLLPKLEASIVWCTHVVDVQNHDTNFTKEKRAKN